MVASIDGRVVVDGWPEAISRSVRRQYEEVHATYAADGWLCGRVTMEAFAKRTRSEAEVAVGYRGPARDDFVAPGKHSSFAFAVDPVGRLAWAVNDIGGDHVVAVLTERVSEDYLAFLRGRGISYLLAGSGELDLALALDKIGGRFGVKTLMLEGGGRINGSLLQAGLVDEVSLLLAPVVDGRMGTPALFDADATAFSPPGLVLSELERRPQDVLWLRYRPAATT
jgi:riboflavin biosynthesis pyrimidine reductase